MSIKRQEVEATVDETTGEVIVLKPQWQGMYNGVVPEPLDFSNPYEDIYEEIPPYTKNEKGEWLNDTSEPKIVKTGQINVQEKIQSFLDDVDIYKILSKIAMSGDESLLHLNDCVYGDIAEIPTNLNDFEEFLAHNVANLPSDIVKVLDDPKHTEAQLYGAIQSYNEKIRQSKVVQEQPKQEEKKVEEKK